MDTNPNTNKDNSTKADSPHKHASNVAVSIAGCAFASFMLAALTGNAWPGAVAACALSLMGIGVVFFMMRRA